MQIVRLNPHNIEDVAEATNRSREEVLRAYTHGKSLGRSVYIFIKGPDFWSQITQNPTENIPIVDEVLNEV